MAYVVMAHVLMADVSLTMGGNVDQYTPKEVEKIKQDIAKDTGADVKDVNVNVKAGLYSYF